MKKTLFIITALIIIIFIFNQDLFNGKRPYNEIFQIEVYDESDTNNDNLKDDKGFQIDRKKPSGYLMIEESNVKREVIYEEVINYEIEKGDTLEKIAMRFCDDGTKWIKIYHYGDNKKIIGDDPGDIKVRQKIKIPVYCNQTIVDF